MLAFSESHNSTVRELWRDGSLATELGAWRRQTFKWTVPLSSCLSKPCNSERNGVQLLWTHTAWKRKAFKETVSLSVFLLHAAWLHGDLLWIHTAWRTHTYKGTISSTSGLLQAVWWVKFTHHGDTWLGEGRHLRGLDFNCSYLEPCQTPKILIFIGCFFQLGLHQVHTQVYMLGLKAAVEVSALTEWALLAGGQLWASHMWSGL